MSDDLTPEEYEILFGEPLPESNDLSQPSAAVANPTGILRKLRLAAAVVVALIILGMVADARAIDPPDPDTNIQVDERAIVGR